MPERELTNAQRALLLALMIKAGPVENRHLVALNIDLRKRPYRDQLDDWELITVKEKPEVSYLTLELTEKGWGRAVAELSADAPPLGGVLGGTLHLLLGVLRRHFEKHELAAADFFTTYAEVPEPPPAKKPSRRASRTKSAVAEDLEARIRKAYATVAPEPGAWVMLDEIRSSVGETRKASVDDALRRLGRQPGVSLIPESNQKVLTAEQRSAAVRIGNQDVHLLAIGR